MCSLALITNKEGVLSCSFTSCFCCTVVVLLNFQIQQLQNVLWCCGTSTLLRGGTLLPVSAAAPRAWAVSRSQASNDFCHSVVNLHAEGKPSLPVLKPSLPVLYLLCETCYSLLLKASSDKVLHREVSVPFASIRVTFHKGLGYGVQYYPRNQSSVAFYLVFSPCR